MGLFGSKTTTNTGDAVKHPGTPTGGLTIGSAVLGSGGGGYAIQDEYMNRHMEALRRYQDQATMQSMYPPRVTVSRYDVSDDDSRKIMIAMRLRLDEGGKWPFQHISTAHAGDKVFVFVVQNNGPVTLEDDASLFPSDLLVSQLTLLK